MKKGFTLMEMLAVILVIAVIVSMAAPVFRSVRYEVRNSQAKAAVKKMAEAVKSYYQANRGQKLQGCFTNTTSFGNICEASGARGIPGSSSSQVGVKNLFTCGYLTRKDFASVPYTFCVNYESTISSLPPGFKALPSGAAEGKIFAFAGGTDDAGKKYKSSEGMIFVDETLTVKDTYGD